MSTSDLYILNGKSVRHACEFRNGWGTAPRCWDYLAEKYIPEKPVYSMEEGHLRKVWDLADDPRLEEHEQIALMMTFDRMYIPLDQVEKAAEACEKFGAECEDGTHVNHWPAIAHALREVAKMNINRHARGVCLSSTSVCDPWIDADQEYLKKAWPIFEAAA